MIEVVLTEDSSPTIFNTQFNAHYHSIFGAEQESLHVFIQNGFLYYIQQYPSLPTINILEVGLGTGLNCFLTYHYWNELKDIQPVIHYFAIEKYPLEASIIQTLKNYLPFQNNKELFCTMHQELNTILLHNNFNLHKIIGDARDIINDIENNSLNIIYYDAFAPSAQSEMWQKEIFEMLYLKLKTNGILVTFCAKGQFKRDLKFIGFEVQSLPGSLGKREMTRAIKV